MTFRPRFRIDFPFIVSRVCHQCVHLLRLNPQFLSLPFPLVLYIVPNLREWWTFHRLTLSSYSKRISGLFVGVNSVISSSETLNGSASSSLSSQHASIYNHGSCNSTFTICFRAEFNFVSYFPFRLKTFHGLVPGCGDGFLDDVCFGTESNHDVSIRILV